MDTQTHVWLGIIAIVSVLQFTGMLTVAIVASRKVRRAEALVEERIARLEMVTNEAIRDIRPLLKQASVALNDLADLSARLRQLDSQVTETVSSVSKGVRMAGGVVLSRMWPAAGILHAVAAGARALRARRRRARARDDAREISRFMNEGGGHG